MPSVIPQRGPLPG